MAKVHMVLNSQGGVGKSFVATILAQYKMHKGQKPLCIDTDLVNATFTRYKALNVTQFKIDDCAETNTSNLDRLMQHIPASHDDLIIDNGPGTFAQMSRYLIHNQTPGMLARSGHQLVVHTIITGGQAFIDTINNFSQLISQIPNNALLIVWLNPYWGVVEDAGQTFEHMNAYHDNKKRISAIVNIPKLNEATFGRDLSDMLQERLTFDEAIPSPARFIITRQRLKMTRDKLFSELDKAVVV